MIRHQTRTVSTHPTRRPVQLRAEDIEDSTGPEVVHRAGEIDFCTASTLWACLIEQLDDNTECPVLVVDLAAVNFMSCSGLSVLLDVQQHAAAHGTALRLTRCPRVVRRLLEAAGLKAQFRIYPTIRDALP